MISKNTIADLHIHSYYSDSSYTPSQIVEKLLQANIGIASLTDHNTIDGVKEFVNLASSAGITAITGVEVSSKIGDMVYHILAYGFNPDDPRIPAYVDPLLSMMKENNRKLIVRMSEDYDEINIPEYDEYSYDRTRGGWKFVNYICDKGITEKPIDGLSFYSKYGFQLSNCDYPSPGEVIKEILSWGAFPVLAHPQGYFKEEFPSKESVSDLFNRFASSGLQGVECYHYRQNDHMIQISVDWCTANNMIITAGSDSHGSFVTENDIGSMRIPLSQLNLGHLTED
ncbi:MAG: PHP domain-containing protein [Clostridia bacterium]|nr:PHP domain-containing protein [Clostridia bacterium]